MPAISAAYIRAAASGSSRSYGACYSGKAPAGGHAWRRTSTISRRKVDFAGRDAPHPPQLFWPTTRTFLIDSSTKARAAGIDARSTRHHAGHEREIGAEHVEQKCQSKVPEKLGIMPDKWGATRLCSKKRASPTRRADLRTGGAASTACTVARMNHPVRQPAHLVQRQSHSSSEFQAMQQTSKGTVRATVRKPSPFAYYGYQLVL